MQNSEKNRIYKIIMLVIITAIITFMVTSIGMYNYLAKTESGLETLISNIELSEDTKDINKKFEIVKKYLETHYIGDINSSDMVEMAIKGYVAGLGDEYTEYLMKDEYEELLISVTGDYVGIGIYMYQDTDGNIVVLEPIEGSPAEEAGLQSGDIIISINGENCLDMDINIAATKIKGKEGTTVELEILRGNETITKTVERKTVEIKDSRAEVLEGNIGYIELTTFDEGCTENIENYILDFQNKGINSVIIDLRDNTGGVVTEAINFSELFIKRGDTIMRSYNKTDKETVVTSNNTNPIDVNLVILVNQYSASATEIVSAALQDNKVATIVGTKTYGKGVMQEVFPLFEGALKVTIEEFKTPNGNKIDKVGITPDKIVEDNLETEEDEQLAEAINLLK